MTIKTLTFNPFQTNCYVCHDQGEAVLVDPGCHTAREQQAVVDYLENHGLTLRHLLLTHAHIDHIFGCAYFTERYGQSFRMHRADKAFIERAQDQALLFGIPLVQPPMPETDLEEGDTITFGEVTWQILFTPGHSPGSVCFYDAEGEAVIAGDVLFAGSIGRTDLPQGSLPQLMQSIFQKLLPLGDTVRVYPGHGPATTIGRERRTNPFLTSGFAVP